MRSYDHPPQAFTDTIESRRLMDCDVEAHAILRDGIVIGEVLAIHHYDSTWHCFDSFGSRIGTVDGSLREAALFVKLIKKEREG